MSPSLFEVRSLLFLPASNPRAIARAREAGADMVVLDLDDAVKPADKEGARTAAAEAFDAPWPVPVGIRVNGEGTMWHDADLQAVARSKAELVVVPRVSSPAIVDRAGKATGKPVLAMIESAAGVIAAPEIAKCTVGLIAGTNDLRAELGIPTNPDRSAIAMALQWIVLAARSAGVPAFDGVFNTLKDEGGLEAQAREGRALGFSGKSLIHPDQIVPCHKAFSPSDSEIDRAERLVAAFDGGAERFEDEMIERMHVEAARRLLNRVN